LIRLFADLIGCDTCYRCELPTKRFATVSLHENKEYRPERKQTMIAENLCREHRRTTTYSLGLSSDQWIILTVAKRKLRN